MSFHPNDPGHVAEHNRLVTVLPEGFTPVTDALIGAANGIAELDGNGLLPETQVPVRLQGTQLTAAYGASVNVMAYGAAGDGVTNDRAAIQSALDAAASDGARTVILPRGTYILDVAPSKDYMLSIAAGVTLRGDSHGSTVLKVKASAGDYRAVITGATSSTNLSGVVLDGITFDMNNTGNPVVTQANLFAGYPRYAFYAPAGDGITVRDCVFRDIDAVNTVALNGTTITDARVQNCRFTGIGNSSATHDYSAIYISGQRMVVTGNMLEGVLGGESARTAIETHGGGQVVSGNVIQNFYTGMNITGVNANGSDSIEVVGNTLTDVMIGIHLWSYTGSTGLRNCDVSHNSIRVERDSWISGTSDYPRGILLEPSSSQTVENLRIQSNTIVFNTFSAAALASEYQASGIDLPLSSGSVEVHNLDVFDNLVVGALSAGLRLTATTRRARISRNRFVDCGASTDSGMASLYKSGITLVGTLYDVLVDSNQVFDTRGTHLLAQGAMTSLTAVTRCTQYDNTVVCVDGASLPSFVDTAGKAFALRAAYPQSSAFTHGLYYGPQGTRSTLAATAGTMTCVPFVVSNTQAFDRIGCEVTVAGATGTVIELGIYADNGNGTPGAVVLDAGVVPGDAVAAAELTVAVTLQPGLYWLAAVPQGGSPTVRTITSAGQPVVGAGSLAAATAGTPRNGFTQTGVTGALPSSFVSSGQTQGGTIVVLRAN